ncbi:delta-aminolevulinic acid dehydratase [Tetranychus urticae]|uniref:Delta-aminolevulinic acid dehydratase n=1 Tax=Tetranychus urticae TaxID=32264 RepID=T1L1R7_TETUR|nr:delta-aminolevulinic acid dehydratase [Tetranychus urticae]
MDSINLRTSLVKPIIRQWMCQGSASFTPSNFVLPLFIINNDDEIQEISSMPEVYRYGVNRAIEYLSGLVNDKGLRSILLFPVVSSKSINDSTDPAFNPVLRLIPLIRKQFPNLYVIVDVCLCGFSSDGHCYVANDSDGVKDNDATLTALANLSVAYAKSGCHMVAPSDMNDGRVAVIRSELNKSSFNDVSIMSYSAKFASNFYGPFRDAAGSAPKHGDRKSYQLTPGSSGLAMRAIARDIAEGADIIMVKPGLPYLDIISEAKNRFPDIPRAVYHVSGEYSMLYQAGISGCFDLNRALWEILISFKRAGAEIIITYFTPKILDLLKDVEL